MHKLRLTALCAVVLSSSANAAPLDATWLGGTGNWNDGSFWAFSAATASGFPDNAADTFSVLIDNNNLLGSVVSLNVDATIDALTIGVGDQFRINNDRTLRIENSLVNDGIFEINDNGIGAPATLELNETVTYSGNGVFSNSFTSNNRILGIGALPTLVNQTDFILDAGRLSLQNLTIENQGSLQANDGATLTIDGVSHIIGGAINAFGTGDVQTESGVTIEDVTVGHLRVLNNRLLNVIGDLTVNGGLRLEDNGLSGITALELDGIVNYRGTGALETTNTLQNRIVGSPGAGLNIVDDLLVTGINGFRGSLTISGFDVTNNAKLIADNARVRLGQSTITNSLGSFEALNGSDIEFDTDLTINGGALTADSASRFVALGGSGILLNGVTLDTGSEFVVVNNTTVDLSTSFTNNGVVVLQDNGLSGLSRLLVNGSVDYSGTGFFSNSNTLQNRIVGADLAAILNNTTDLRLNNGQMLVDDLTLNNQMKIIADRTSELSTNLRFDNTTINNLSPVSGLVASNGATIELGTGIINNGSLSTTSNGLFRVIGNSAWNGVSIDAGSDVTVTNNSSVTLSGSFVNDGQILLQDNGLSGITALQIDGAVDYSGNGIINANNNSQNRLTGIGGAPVLNNTSNLLLDSGQLQIEDLTINNQNAITAGDGTIIRLALNNVINGGVLTSVGSGVVRTTSGFGANTTLLKDVTVGTGGTLQILNNLAFRIQGSLAIDGEIQISDNDLSGISGLLIEGPVSYFGGTGHIAPSLSYQNQITGEAGSTFTIEEDLMVIGGRLSFDDLMATNNAKVIGDGAGLRLQSSTFTQTAGEVAVTNGGEIELGNNLLIDGGVLSSDETSEIETQGSTAVLRDVTLKSGSFLRVNNNNRLALEDSFDNDGTIQLNDNNLAGLTEIFVTNNVSWSGDGVFNNSLSFQNRISGELDAGVSVDAGQLVLAGGNMLIEVDNFTNNALVGSEGGGFLDIADSVNISNLVGNTLSGGAWRSKDSGSIVEISGAAIINNNAEIILSGIGSVFRGTTNLEETLTNSTTNGVLRVLENRAYATSNDFDNQGVLQLGGGNWTSMSLNNGGSAEVFGFGSVTPQVSNDGLLRASGGVLSILGGVVGTTGAIEIEADAGLIVGAASNVASLSHNGSAPDSLNLQGFDVTVHHDYTNANFGVGNDFDARANVIGAGQILAAGDVAQNLTGDVSNGETTAADLNFGNVHVGDLNTLNYQVANIGNTGPSLRGALQDAVNGGSITDARLAGSGVTAGNFGPIATGNTSGDLAVVFDATSAGALTGQVVRVENNFDNVLGQNLSISGAAYRYADPVITPDPITLANVHVNDISEHVLNVLNDVPDDGFSEALNASFGENTGEAINNAGSINLLGPSAANNTALVAGINTSTAGAKTGTVTLNLVSDGTGSSELGLTDLAAQTINVSGNVFRFATADVGANPIALANVHVNEVSNQNLVIANNAAADGFSESLNASFGGSSGDAINNGANINLLAAGGVSANAMVVGIDTSTAGSKSGTVAVNLVSDGSGTSGLGQTILDHQNIDVSGNVYGYAVAEVGTAALDFVMRRGDAAVMKDIALSNIAANDGFHEGLDVAVQSLTPGYDISGATAMNVAAGGSNNATLSLLGTSSGEFNGSVDLEFESNGTLSGLANTALSTQTVNLTGRVYETAVAEVTPTTIDLGIVHVGDASPSANIAVANNANGELNDRLRGSVTSTPTGFSASGDLGDGVAAGSTDSNSLSITLDTATAGVFSGDAVLSLFSHNDELADVALAAESVALIGQVNNYVNPVVNKISGDGVFSGAGAALALDFGDVEFGSDLIDAVFGILNDVAGPADTLRGEFNFGSTNFDYAGFNAFTGVNAGESQNGLVIGIDTLTAGLFEDIITIQLFGFNASGFEQALAPIQLTVSANILAAPVPLPAAVWMLMGGLLVLVRKRKPRAV